VSYAGRHGAVDDVRVKAGTRQRTDVPPAGPRRPLWPAGAERRRPSGQDVTRRRTVPRAVWGWSAVLLVSVAGLLLATAAGGIPALAAADRALADLLRTPGWREVPADVTEVTAVLGYRVVWVPTVLVLAWFARWRPLLVYVGTISLIAGLAQLAVGDARLLQAVREGVTGSQERLVLPSWPVLVLAAVAVATLLALTPSGRIRRVGWAVVVVVLVAQVGARALLGQSAVSSSVLSAAAGCAGAALAFAVLAPEAAFPVHYRRVVKAHLELDADRTRRVRDAVRDQLGLEVAGLEPYRLDGSAGSTPCRLRLASGTPQYLFGKLYAVNHLRSDRWYKFARVLRYGRLEDEAPFSSVRRLAEHEDYMLRLLRDSGVAVPEPIGVVEAVPGREYLLVTELVPHAVEILDSDGSDAVVDDALRQIRRLWSAGAAHRDIKPSNVLAQGARVVLVDVSFGELRPSRWRQAVDLADMLLILGLLAGPDRALARAAAFFDNDELAEAFATTSSVTVPRQLRRLLDESGRDLVAEFRGRLPSRARVRVQRWSVRRVGLALATVGGLVAVGLLLWLNLRAGGLL
jgi:RIO1 family